MLDPKPFWRVDVNRRTAGPQASPRAFSMRNAGPLRLRRRSAMEPVPEEDNVLINPAHADSARLVATKPRRFVYDHRV
jgi:hypothetical protein